MKLDWEKVLKELSEFTERTPLHQLDDMTIDTLYGSMFGLNLRYMTLERALEEQFCNMLNYSIYRIKRLLKKTVVWNNSQNIFSSLHPVGFGTFGWKYEPEVIELALKRNVLIDTAEGYGYGRVEKKLGEIFSKNTKHQPSITSKVSRNHMSPASIKLAAYRSKENLKVPFHYQLHYPHNTVPDELISRVLSNLKKFKIILSIGMGNCSVDMIESLQYFLADCGHTVSSVQVRYNLVDRRIERFLLPYCQQHNIPILAYSPLGQKFSEINQPILTKMGKKYDCTPAQIALAWILKKPLIIPIPRTNNLEHMKENLDASKIKLTDEDMEKINISYNCDYRF